jgi:hypothetical protein
MKKTIKLIAAITAIAVFTAGCGGSMSSAGPKEVLNAFFERIAKKDIDGAAKFATKDSKAALDMMKKAVEMEGKLKDEGDKKEAEDDDMKNMELGEPKIEGDIATVPVKDKKKGTQFNIPMKKEDGAWKVNFTMSALKGMSGENEEGAAGDDHSNMNSEDMQKGIEMADSIMKNMDPEKMEKMKEAIEKMKEAQ